MNCRFIGDLIAFGSNTLNYTNMPCLATSQAYSAMSYKSGWLSCSKALLQSWFSNNGPHIKDQFEQE